MPFPTQWSVTDLKDLSNNQLVYLAQHLSGGKVLCQSFITDLTGYICAPEYSCTGCYQDTPYYSDIDTEKVPEGKRPESTWACIRSPFYATEEDRRNDNVSWGCSNCLYSHTGSASFKSIQCNVQDWGGVENAFTYTMKQIPVLVKADLSGKAQWKRSMKGYADGEFTNAERARVLTNLADELSKASCSHKLLQTLPVDGGKTQAPVLPRVKKFVPTMIGRPTNNSQWAGSPPEGALWEKERDYFAPHFMDQIAEDDGHASGSRQLIRPAGTQAHTSKKGSGSKPTTTRHRSDPGEQLNFGAAGSALMDVGGTRSGATPSPVPSKIEILEYRKRLLGSPPSKAKTPLLPSPKFVANPKKLVTSMGGMCLEGASDDFAGRRPSPNKTIPPRGKLRFEDEGVDMQDGQDMAAESDIERVRAPRRAVTEPGDRFQEQMDTAARDTGTHSLQLALPAKQSRPEDLDMMQVDHAFSERTDTPSPNVPFKNLEQMRSKAQFSPVDPTKDLDDVDMEVELDVQYPNEHEMRDPASMQMGLGFDAGGSRMSVGRG